MEDPRTTQTLEDRIMLLEAELQLARAIIAAANIDALTGANTRAAYERFKDTPLAAQLHYVVIDINLFKEVNDSLGHSVGDQVLQYVGECIRIVCGAYRLSVRQRFYRYGGDELVVLVEPDLVSKVARSIDAMIAKKLRPSEFQELPQITVSCGYGPDFATADRAMYQIKQAAQDE